MAARSLSSLPSSLQRSLIVLGALTKFFRKLDLTKIHAENIRAYQRSRLGSLWSDCAQPRVLGAPNDSQARTIVGSNRLGLPAVAHVKRNSRAYIDSE
jgi:hypothetical protein